MPTNSRTVAASLAGIVHFITSFFGAFGVALFVLISGFVIPYSFRNYSAKGFLVGRLLRIYPTYCVGFALGLITIACVGYTYDKPFPYTLREVVLHIPGLRDLLWSRSIDGVIWTLEVEVRFYLLCAMLAPWLRVLRRRVFLVPLALSALILVAINPWIDVWAQSNLELYKLGATASLIGQNIVYMFIGVVWFYLRQKALERQQTMLLVSLLLLLFALMWRTGIYASSFPQIVSYLAACIIFIAGARFLNGHGLVTRFLSGMARLSYPMYVVHGVLGYALLNVLAATGLPSMAIVVTFAIIVAMSAIIHFTIEEPTRRIGQRWARALSPHGVHGERANGH